MNEITTSNQRLQPFGYRQIRSTPHDGEDAFISALFGSLLGAGAAMLAEVGKPRENQNFWKATALGGCLGAGAGVILGTQPVRDISANILSATGNVAFASAQAFYEKVTTDTNFYLTLRSNDPGGTLCLLATCCRKVKSQDEILEKCFKLRTDLKTSSTQLLELFAREKFRLKNHLSRSIQKARETTSPFFYRQLEEFKASLKVFESRIGEFETLLSTIEGPIGIALGNRLGNIIIASRVDLALNQDLQTFLVQKGQKATQEFQYLRTKLKKTKLEFGPIKKLFDQYQKRVACEIPESVEDTDGYASDNSLAPDSRKSHEKALYLRHQDQEKLNRGFYPIRRAAEIQLLPDVINRLLKNAKASSPNKKVELSMDVVMPGLNGRITQEDLTQPVVEVSENDYKLICNHLDQIESKLQNQKNFLEVKNRIIDLVNPGAARLAEALFVSCNGGFYIRPSVRDFEVKQIKNLANVLDKDEKKNFLDSVLFYLPPSFSITVEKNRAERVYGLGVDTYPTVYSALRSEFPKKSFAALSEREPLFNDWNKFVATLLLLTSNRASGFTDSQKGLYDQLSKRQLLLLNQVGQLLFLVEPSRHRGALEQMAHLLEFVRDGKLLLRDLFITPQNKAEFFKKQNTKCFKACRIGKLLHLKKSEIVKYHDLLEFIGISMLPFKAVQDAKDRAYRYGTFYNGQIDPETPLFIPVRVNEWLVSKFEKTNKSVVTVLELLQKRAVLLQGWRQLLRFETPTSKVDFTSFKDSERLPIDRKINPQKLKDLKKKYSQASLEYPSFDEYSKALTKQLAALSKVNDKLKTFETELLPIV